MGMESGSMMIEGTLSLMKKSARAMLFVDTGHVSKDYLPGLSAGRAKLTVRSTGYQFQRITSSQYMVEMKNPALPIQLTKRAGSLVGLYVKAMMKKVMLLPTSTQLRMIK